MPNLDISLEPIIAKLIILLVAFPVHELAHALTADYLGDLTPRRMGRISLNPLRHLDVVGSIMLFIANIGWAKPVLVNPNNLRGNPRRSMLIVAAAGPASNLVMAGLAAIPLRMGLGGSVPYLYPILTYFIYINLVLVFFNLIPIPPLDGYKILMGILPPEMTFRLRPLEQYGFLILIALIFFLPMLGINTLGWLVFTPANLVSNYLMG